MSDEHSGVRYLVHGDDVLAVAVARQLLATPDALVTVVIPPQAADLIGAEPLSNANVLITARLDPETLARCGPTDAAALLSRGSAARNAMLVSATYPQARLVVRTDLDPDATASVRRFSPAVLTARAYLAAVATVAPRQHRPLTRLLRAERPRRQQRVVRDQLRARATRAAFIALAFAAVSTLLLVVLEQISISQALYITLLRGADEPDFDSSTAVQMYQVGFALLTILGSVMTGVYLGDALQQGRALAAAGAPAAGTSGHLVLVGLGERGTQVLQALHEVGEEVVAVDTQPTARGVRAARQRDIPVIIDDARWTDTLRQAALERSRAMLVLLPDDDTGLEITMAAHSIRPDLPVIWLPADSEVAALAYRLERVTVPDLTLHHLARAIVASLRDGRQHERQDRRAVIHPHTAEA
ncbi:NAD(P)-binding protein [Micromonospora lupini]|uniref:NAD(P)-binding protein n=1 Tax=Micromonospora lupini TaxID=285679 RepID=UPI0033D17ADC